MFCKCKSLQDDEILCCKHQHMMTSLLDDRSERPRIDPGNWWEVPWFHDILFVPVRKTPLWSPLDTANWCQIEKVVGASAFHSPLSLWCGQVFWVGELEDLAAGSCTCVCVCVPFFQCEYVSGPLYSGIYKYTYRYRYRYTCMYIYICVYIYVYIYSYYIYIVIYIYSYIYIYMCIHTCTPIIPAFLSWGSCASSWLFLNCEFGATKLIHSPLCQVGTTTCSCRTTLGVLDAASLAFTCLASGQRFQRALFWA